ncbi:MAG: winged helix DNA-binding domain-containing protein [Anaerolineae bacterium]|nr:winged helix DNA-binding domain-containing protein [Anaerolineae bacterium]
MERLSLTQARNLMLAAQGLLNGPEKPAGKQDVLFCIRKMGVLQIDTIHVVARSPYLVLFSRLGSYTPSWLDELEAEGKLFEYWAHAACYIPVEDFALFRRIMLEDHHPHYISPEWLDEHRDMQNQILQRIRDEGPLRSADFEQSKTPGLWWNWKDEKRILEHLFNLGELMISRRIKFQRVYDLSQRVMPAWQDEMAPDFETVKRELIMRSVHCLGITRPEWVADYYRLPKKGIGEYLNRLAEDQRLITCEVDGFNDVFYIHPDHRGVYDQACRQSLQATYTTLLSPFDPLVWDRTRARQLFDFDYTIEAYVPAPKRKYGYFCLPLLWKGQLIGRVDAKAHRSAGCFEIKTLYLESGVTVNDGLLSDICQALIKCAHWHSCSKLIVTDSFPGEVAERINQMISVLQSG